MIAFDDVGATGNEAIWPTAGKTGICSIYPHILYIYIPGHMLPIALTVCFLCGNCKLSYIVRFNKFPYTLLVINQYPTCKA